MITTHSDVPFHILTSYLNETVSDNATKLDDFDGQWNFASSFTLFTIIAGTTANLFVLWLFYLRPLLRTLFSLYLINLLTANFIMSSVLQPMNLFSQYYSSWKFGYQGCVFRHYVGWTISDVIIVSHFLIAINRLWAVTFPVSYRNNHNKKTSIKVCISAWTIINISIIPTILSISHLSNLDKDGEQHCGLNTESIGAWGSVLQLLYYDLPVVLVFVFFTIICYRSFIGTRQQRRIRAVNGVLVGRSLPLVSRAGPDIPATDSLQAREERGFCCGQPRYGSRAGFLTLMLVTLSVLICHAPNEVYFTMLMVVDYDPPGLFTAVRVLQSLTTIFDPLLIVLAGPELENLAGRQFSRLMIHFQH